MATTKRTQPKPKAPKHGDYNELAAHVAAVIANPATPAGLYNALVDELTSYARFDWHTPAEVERALANAAEKEDV
jgi:hypothetical protein